MTDTRIILLPAFRLELGLVRRGRAWIVAVSGTPPRYPKRPPPWIHADRGARAGPPPARAPTALAAPVTPPWPSSLPSPCYGPNARGSAPPALPRAPS